MLSGWQWDDSGKRSSDHELDVLVDVLAAVAPVAVVGDGLADAGGEGAVGRGQFEGEDEGGDLLEVLARLVDLSDDVLEADDVSAEVLLHLRVGLDLHALLAVPAVELLVDQLADQLLRRLAPGDVVLHLAQLPDVRQRAPQEDCGVDAPQVELVQDDLLLLGDVGHSSHSHHQQQLADARRRPFVPACRQPLLLSVLSNRTMRTLSL